MAANSNSSLHASNMLMVEWLPCLQSRKTLLTESEDASFLFNSIIDAIVDHAMPVVQVWQLCKPKCICISYAGSIPQFDAAKEVISRHVIVSSLAAGQLQCTHCM